MENHVHEYRHSSTRGKKGAEGRGRRKKKRVQVDGAVIAQFTTASRRDRRRE
jgi:hypothetical protein